jgi:hypothetical protein
MVGVINISTMKLSYVIFELRFLLWWDRARPVEDVVVW